MVITKNKRHAKIWPIHPLLPYIISNTLWSIEE